ncbi:MAG: methylenetetrahydrofolate--tRNA-(uracil(54)-C(5))-methyltransferase (FADH(2)-oxidizing) TrmFO [Alphaproteobacteria bacterium]|nr:methylenetetrahydrofolate--tRNA-(uracil(54)-C(5))-methyltransferase (FADH(2)-oxidizing) TrmFO [Alphaproteobacteria bacterium]
MEEQKVYVIGAGLAGGEAAWTLASRGIRVVICEMRPSKLTPAHKTGLSAELVCSNSLRSDDNTNSAIGLLHQEMRQCSSLIMEAADSCRVPAGGALAVDRERFAAYVDAKLHSHPLIEFEYGEITGLPALEHPTIIATGPLTSPALIAAILAEIGDQSLNFFDAIAPVVYKDSIDMSVCWYQSRYDKGDKFDYINCPLSKEQYYAFVDALLSAEKVEFHDFEKASYFDGCLPIEVMAERGVDTLLYGPMKPVGLTNPHTPQSKPYAVVQLRQDNREDTLRNIVGFQTKMKYGEQERVFRTIPGLEKAEFARLGCIHKNTFIKSPQVLDDYLRLKTKPHLSFAGQITGCEGYCESAAVGLLAGWFTACRLAGNSAALPPATTALGAVYAHLRDTTNADYQPMNVNFGSFAPLEDAVSPHGKRIHLKGTLRKQAYCHRAAEDIKPWLELFRR